MPRARITRARAERTAATGPVTIVADEAELDAELGVYTLFFLIPRAEVVYFRLVLESWEDGAVARTIDRFHEGDRSRSVVVAIVVPDFLDPCVRRLARLCEEIDGVPVRTTPRLREALRAGLAGRARARDSDGGAGAADPEEV
jgi:hypothetical protein